MGLLTARSYYFPPTPFRFARTKRQVDAARRKGITALNIPKLRIPNFKPENIDRLSEQAMAGVCTGGNPREVTVEDIKAIYRSAYKDVPVTEEPGVFA